MIRSPPTHTCMYTTHINIQRTHNLAPATNTQTQLISGNSLCHNHRNHPTILWLIMGTLSTQQFRGKSRACEVCVKSRLPKYFMFRYCCINQYNSLLYGCMVYILKYLNVWSFENRDGMTYSVYSTGYMLSLLSV